MNTFDERLCEGWFLQDQSGARKAIDIPVIDQNEIIWRHPS
jgi:hypothetical protein